MGSDGPAVFVHGVPDTHHLWDGVIEALDRDDVVAVDLPGFGSPVPDGFGASKQEYLDWLIDQLEAIGAPVDLVGHDWGSILAQRLVCVRPDLVRTWAAGGAALDPAYEWHATAQVWQAPDDGERFMETFTSEGFQATAPVLGIPDDYASVAAEFVDDRMKDCILRLYRSAVDVFTQWGPGLGTAPSRALLIWGAGDPFVPADFAYRSAERVSGKAIVFDDCGHWWPVARPKEVAAALEELWATA